MSEAADIASICVVYVYRFRVANERIHSSYLPSDKPIEIPYGYQNQRSEAFPADRTIPTFRSLRHLKLLGSMSHLP